MHSRDRGREECFEGGHSFEAAAAAFFEKWASICEDIMHIREVWIIFEESRSETVVSIGPSEPQRPLRAGTLSCSSEIVLYSSS